MSNGEKKWGTFLHGDALHGRDCHIETAFYHYYGQVFNDRICGYGVMIYLKNDRVRKEGYWKNGCLLTNGEVTKELNNGTLFVGKLTEKGEPMPGEKGELLYATESTKSHYVGALTRDFQPCGFGTCYFCDGNIYHGSATSAILRFGPNKTLELNHPDLLGSLSQHTISSRKAHRIIKRFLACPAEVADLVLVYGYLVDLMLQVISK